MTDTTAGVIPSYTYRMKTAISLPDELFQRVEAAREEDGKGRSEFFAEAARAYLQQRESERLRAEIDAALTAIAADPDGNDDDSTAEIVAYSMQRWAQHSEDEDW